MTNRKSIYLSYSGSSFNSITYLFHNSCLYIQEHTYIYDRLLDQYKYLHFGMDSGCIHLHLEPRSIKWGRNWEKEEKDNMNAN